MSQEWAKVFYNSEVWQKVRTAYIASTHGLCEVCSKGGAIVHHKDKITKGNINDASITLNWENLQLLCLECHNRAHGNASTVEGLAFTENGELVQASPPV